MAEIKLTAEAREEFGKGAARRIRRANQVPAVLYGKGADPIHITLPGHDTLLALRQANVLLSLQLPGGKAQLALPKQVQRDPLRGTIEHVDLIIVKRGEKVVVEVPLTVVGESASDTSVSVERTVIVIQADPTNIPNEIEISVEGLSAGAQITMGDVQLPVGSELHEDADILAVHVVREMSEAELEANLAGGEAAAVSEASAAQAATE